MSNTFWTLIEDGYYRVHNGILKHAPMDQSKSTVLKEQESNVTDISEKKLTIINYELGSNFSISDL